MGKISFKNFVVNVDEYRKKLIKHCQQNFLSIDDNASFDTALNLALELGQTLPDDKIPVQFIDLFGNIVETVIAEKGSKVPQPEGPKLDEDLVDFTGWVCEGDLDNIQYPVYCLPTYKPKVDDTGVSPTILVCRFDEETGLSPTIQLTSWRASSSLSNNIYIDWGDGSEKETFNFSSVTTFPHTYSKSGWYIIKINADQKYAVYWTGSKPLLGNNYNKSLIRCYMGDKFAVGRTLFDNCYNLTVACLNNKSIHGPGPYYIDEFFRQCYSLICSYLPSFDNADTIWNIGNYIYENCYNLKYVVSHCTQVGGSSSYSMFSACSNVKLLSSFLMNKKTYIRLGLQSQTPVMIIPQSILVNSQSSSFTGFKKVISENYNLGAYSFSGANDLREIILPIDYSNSLNLNNAVYLYSENLCDIMRKLKDLTNETPSTLKLNIYLLARIKNIAVSNEGEYLGIGVNKGISLFEYIQNKNWTIST